jgi:flagellar motor switch protein FliG
LAVVMLGPWILDGVRGDADSRGGLAALDDYLTERSPADTPEARKRVLADLDRRILRVQVQRGEHPEETPFAYLSEASTTLFVRLLAEEPLAVQATILPHAPGPLSQAFLEAQPPAVREQLVRPLLEHGPAEREELQAVAVAFRDKLARHQVLDHGDGHADPIADLLLAAPVEERRRLIASLRGDPIALRRALGSFVDEETLRALDGEVLATAMARVDPGTAALFVGSLDEVGRKRLLASLPPAAGRAIAEEAEVLTASPARRAAARRAVLQVVRHAVEERGLDLAEINRGLLFRKEVAS